MDTISAHTSVKAQPVVSRGDIKDRDRADMRGIYSRWIKTNSSDLFKRDSGGENADENN